MSDPLDDLFREAKKYIQAERTAKAERKLRPHADKTVEKAEPKLLFTLEENWQVGRAIALIHEETGTVLGNFVEHTHRSVAGARKLIRCSIPVAVSAAEYVSGSWWLGEGRRPEPKQEWHTQRECVVHLHLSELGVHSPATLVVAHLSYGSIARVELAHETQFAAEGETGQLLITLPAGTNILEVMSRDCKIKVREECGL